MTNLMKTAILLAVSVLAVFTMSGCSKNDYGSNPPPNNNTTPGSVTISNFSFSPTSVTINVGDKVKWTNNDDVSHTVTSNTGSELNSSLFSKGQTFEHTFTTAGTFTYHCTPHPTMTGTVVVK
jgi:plastocyanin